MHIYAICTHYMYLHDFDTIGLSRRLLPLLLMYFSDFLICILHSVSFM